MPAARPRGWRWNWHWFLPRLAAASAILLFAGLGFQQHRRSQHRAELVSTLSMVARDTAVPSVEVLENLDAIQRMDQSVHADPELLAALQ
jgi:hypothetical protein